MIRQHISTEPLGDGFSGEIHVLGKRVYAGPPKDSELAAYIHCCKYMQEYERKYNRSYLIDAINGNFAG